MQKEEECVEIDLSAFDFMHHIRSLLGDLAALVSPASSISSVAPVDTQKRVEWILSRFDEAKSALEGMEGLHLSHEEQLQLRDDLLQQIRRKQDYCLRYQRHEIFEGSAAEMSVKDEETHENDQDQ